MLGRHWHLGLAHPERMQGDFVVRNFSVIPQIELGRFRVFEIYARRESEDEQ